MEHLASRLATIPRVLAVTLGGSRAQGRERPDSDWDFGLYYRDGLDVGALRALGFQGVVVEPGEWAPFMYGGAWLRVDGVKVDVLYRNLDVVERYAAMASEGRFEIARTPGYLIGMPSYVLMGEVAIGRVLAGSLPRWTFPDVLREKAPIRWGSEAEFALLHAEMADARGDNVVRAGCLAQALVALAHGRLCARGEWALNDKDVVARAGLEDVELTVVGVRDAL